MKIYKYCVKDSHSFLHISYASHKVEYNCFCKKFETVLHLSNTDIKDGKPDKQIEQSEGDTDKGRESEQ